MRVSDVVFCLNATNITGQGVCANNILSVLNPEYVPGLFSFSVVIVLLGLDGKDHNIKIAFKTPTEDDAAVFEGPVPVLPDDSNLPAEYKGLNLTINFNNLDFKISGVYKLQVLIDGDILQEKEIFVKGKNEE